MKFILLLIFLFFFPPPALSFYGKLVKVLAGDTVEVLHSGKAERIRLQGVDAPEKGQPYGNKARRFVIDAAAGKIVEVQPVTPDRYGRVVAEVTLPRGESLNRLLMSEGYAWWYRKYSVDVSLGTLEERARALRLGLWADPDPVPPWEWRKGVRMARTEIKKSVSAYRCGEKHYCKEMASCDEALFFLRECGLSRLDGDGDGKPCESICR